MLIATFNCNSVRSRLEVILAWLYRHRPDVLALQETKCADDQFPVQAFTKAGWHVVYRGQKRYNGVAMITRHRPDEVSFGLQDGDEGESEPRLACIKLGALRVLNTYVPQGRELESENFQDKLRWFERLRGYLERNFNASRTKLAWVGDLNVAPLAMDVYDSKRIWPHVCHCREVIDAFENVTSWGLIDVFRKHLPEAGTFTFWDYRLPKAVDRNLGWRIDHVLATRSLAKASTDCFVDIGPRKVEKPSDHTFVAARFEP